MHPMDALPEVIVATIGGLLADARDRCNLAIALASNAPHLLVRTLEMDPQVDHLSAKLDAALRACPNLTDLVLTRPTPFDAALVSTLARARDRIGRKPRIRFAFHVAWLAHADVVDIDVMYIQDMPFAAAGAAEGAAEGTAAGAAEGTAAGVSMNIAVVNVLSMAVPQAALDALAASSPDIRSMVFRSMASMDALRGVDAFFMDQRACRSVIVDERTVGVVPSALATPPALAAYVTDLFVDGSRNMASVAFIASNFGAMKALRRVHVDALDSRSLYHRYHSGLLVRFFAACKHQVELCIGENMLSDPAALPFARLARASGMTVRLHAGTNAFQVACSALLACALGMVDAAAPLPDCSAWPELATMFGVQQPTAA